MAGSRSEGISTPLPPPQLLSQNELETAARLITRPGGAATMITGPTGTGKSSKIPPFLAMIGKKKGSGNLNPGRSIVIVPTIESVRNLYNRVTKEYPELKVGYAAESEIRYDDSTDLAYVTSGHARRYYINKFRDPHVRGFNDFKIIFLDEIHTGGVDYSLMVNMWQYYVEKELGLIPRLVLVSATPIEGLISDTSIKIASYTIPRPSPYPVRVVYSPGPVPIRSLYDEIEALVTKIHYGDKEPGPGHIIVFVPGIAQALSLEGKLQRRGLTGAVILSIYSSKDKSERQEALDKVHQGVRLILIATNIIESSVTVPGTKYIISSMFEKRPGKSATGGLLLEEHLITKNSAEQQAGRTGRTCPGVVYRMIEAAAYEKLERSRPLDIYQVPIHNEILEIIEVGQSPLPFLRGVDRVQIQTIMTDLVRLQMVTASPLQVTEIGKFSTGYPLGVRSTAFLWTWFTARRPDGGRLPAVIGLIIAALINDDPSHLFMMPRREHGETEEAYEARRLEHINEKFVDLIGSDHLATVLNLWIAVNSGIDVDLIFGDDGPSQGPQHRRQHRERADQIRNWCKENSISRPQLVEVVKTVRRCLKVARKQGFDVRNGRFDSEKAAEYARPILRHVNGDMTMKRDDYGPLNRYRVIGGGDAIYRLSTSGIPGTSFDAENIVPIVIHQAKIGGRVISYVKFALSGKVAAPVPERFLETVTANELGLDTSDSYTALSPRALLKAVDKPRVSLDRLKIEQKDETTYQAELVTMPAAEIYTRPGTSLGGQRVGAASPSGSFRPSSARRFGLRASVPVHSNAEPIDLIPPTPIPSSSSDLPEDWDI